MKWLCDALLVLEFISAGECLMLVQQLDRLMKWFGDARLAVELTDERIE